MYIKETLTKINDRYLSDYTHRIGDYEVSKANRYIKIIEYSRSNTSPKVGDKLRLTTKHGDYFHNAHIDKIEDGEAYVCESPYVPFVNENNKGGVYCSTSGGAWQYIPLNQLKYLGKELKTFKDWGSCGACADGAVEFEAEVSVWEYKEENSLYGEYTTKDYAKIYISYCVNKQGEPKDGSRYRYFSFDQGIAFENDTEYQAWINTYKAKVFGNVKEDQSACVFYYREHEHLISEEEWNKLDLPMDTRRCNGVILVKVKYDDEKHCIDTYRYSNSGEYWDVFKPYMLARGIDVFTSKIKRKGGGLYHG